MAIGLMVFVLPSSAQVRFGVKGGMSFNSLDFKGDFGTAKENMSGFYLGPMAEVTIPVIGLGIDGSLLFSSRGKDAYGNKQIGAEIPLNLKYTFGLGSTLGVFVAAGPDFFFNFAEAKKYKDISFERKNTQVGLNIGAGLKLLRHLQLSANYTVPLGDSFTAENAKGKDYSYKNKAWQISLAYMF